jgi:starch phosphorylase
MSGQQPSRSDGTRTMQAAVAVLAERLPDALKPLARMAYNYRWSWMPRGVEIFRDLDPTLWPHARCNPLAAVEIVPPRRLHAAAGDPAYVAKLQAVSTLIDADLTRPPADLGIAPDRPVAYFCSEFGVHCSLPLYGGGLGVLAGDVLKSASDIGLPMVGVGLLYRQGYFHQRLDQSGWQTEYWIDTDFQRLPAVRVTGDDGLPITVSLGVRGRPVVVQVWRVDVGRVPLFLLDTDRPENHVIDRLITARLYVGDRHTRLAQYAVLAIGGPRMLSAMGITPSLVHLNEGHGAGSILARAHEFALARGCSFEEGLQAARNSTVFTTHTPVPAGNEAYSEAEAEPVFGTFADEFGVSRQQFYDTARLPTHDSERPLNVTALALRGSRAANAVSRRHGEVARAMWQPLWPDRAVKDVPIDHVTNGVHTLTWMARPMQRLLDVHLDERWQRDVSDPAVWEAVTAIPDKDLWAVRRELRQGLVEYVRETSVRNRHGRGEAPDYVEAAARVFSPDVLTFGFARRVATYKRLYLMTQLGWDAIDRLMGDGPTPAQFIFAGKAHPRDQEAKQSLQYGMGFRFQPQVARRTVFLEDYDLHMAPRLVAGVDVWLNLPRPPMEASGTSGMKAVLNGGLNLSVLDGWWAEAYDGTNGWAIETPEGDPAFQDDHDARALATLLLDEVVPLFYEREADGIPHRWVQKIKASMRTLVAQFTADRMMREYVAKMYRPSGT